MGTKRLRRGLMVLLGAAAMLLSALPAGADVSGGTGTQEEATVVSDADLAFELGVLQGEGDGLTAEYLMKPTTRLQAVILYLRLKGLEETAAAYMGMETFDDASSVWESGRPILAYLKANPDLGWQGTGDNTFDPLAIITSEQFVKVLLEALGYKQDMDFAYSEVLTKAASVGLSTDPAGHSLMNSDIASQLMGALQVMPKGESQTLSARLNLPADKLQALSYSKLIFAWKAETGPYLTDGAGKALYWFKNDAKDVNACQDACLQNWPVFYEEKLRIPAGLDKADFGVLVRTDGTEQTTYRGWPLYYYAADTEPGDTIGQGFKDVWYLIGQDVTPRQASVPQMVTIEISGFKFTTPELTVPAGTKVTFTNLDQVKHNAAAKDGSFRTPLLSKGESATVVFDKPGVYDYVCEPHKNSMKGTIIVK